MIRSGVTFMLKSFWHMTSTELLARTVLGIGAAVLGSLGLSFSSPVVTTLAAAAVFLLIYRLRYKHL
jgi:hypothetical protein